MKNTQEKLPILFKKQWLKALRSGKYQQGKDNLRSTDNKFCCLGVAAHVVGCTCITGKSYIENDSEYSSKIRGISKVPKILIGNGDIPGELADMNDRGTSFDDIADWIQENL